jgi:hypothetical protein
MWIKIHDTWLTQSTKPHIPPFTYSYLDSSAEISLLRTIERITNIHKYVNSFSLFLKQVLTVFRKWTLNRNSDLGNLQRHYNVHHTTLRLVTDWRLSGTYSYAMGHVTCDKLLCLFSCPWPKMIVIRHVTALRSYAVLDVVCRGCNLL